MKGASSYQSQQLNAASPALLVAMMIEKAIASLKEAIRAIEAGDVQARWQANNRASEIINHLWLTLDTNAGGDIARNLEQLYQFMMTHLTKVDMRNDPKPAAEVIELLEPLLESWRSLAARGEGLPGRAPGPSGQAPAPASVSAMRLSA